MTKHPTKNTVSEEMKKFIAEPSGILNCYFGFVEGLSSFNNPKCSPWLEMCVAVDEQRDFGPLLELLSKIAPPEMFPFLRDLFERHGIIKGLRGNLQRTPLYADTPAEARLVMAVEDVKELQRHGMGQAKAIEVAAREHDEITEDALAHAVNGQSGAMQRWKKRVQRRKRGGD